MLRHDHGPNYMSDDFQSEIAFLGIEASPSFVRQPEGNGVAERFIRTLKENLLWVRHFETIEALRLALLDFAATYNATWLRERHGYKTPNQIRAEQLGLEPAVTTGAQNGRVASQSTVSKPCPVHLCGQAQGVVAMACQLGFVDSLVADAVGGNPALDRLRGLVKSVGSFCATKSEFLSSANPVGGPPKVKFRRGHFCIGRIARWGRS